MQLVHAVLRPRAEGRAAGAARHPEGAAEQTQERRATVEEAWPLPAVVVAYHVTYDGHPDSYPLHIDVEDPVRRPERADHARAGLRQAARADARSAAATSPRIRTCSTPWRSCQPGQTPEAAEKALIAEFEKLKTEPVTAHELQRAQEPVRARLHRRPRVERGEGAAPGARGGDPQRHHDGRRRVRHLHERHDGRRAARGADLLHARPTGWCCYILPEGRVAMRHPQRPDPRLRLAASWALGVGLWALACARRARSARRATGRRSGRRGRLPRARCKFPPYEVRTLANGMQVVAVLHHEQPAVSMRLLVARARRRTRRARAASPSLDGVAARPGHDDAERRSRSPIRSTSSAARSAPASGTDLTFVNAVVMKDSFDVGDGPAGRRRRATRRSRRRRSIGRRSRSMSSLQVNADDPDYIADVVFDRLVYGFHPYGLPGSGTPETLGGHHARRSAGVPPPVLRPQQHDPRHRRRRDERRGVRRGASACSAAGRAATLPAPAAGRAAAADAAHRRSSTSRTRCRPRSASGSWRFRASIPTTWRGTSP